MATYWEKSAKLAMLADILEDDGGEYALELLIERDNPNEERTPIGIESLNMACRTNSPTDPLMVVHYWYNKEGSMCNNPYMGYVHLTVATDCPENETKFHAKLIK